MDVTISSFSSSAKDTSFLKIEVKSTKNWILWFGHSLDRNTRELEARVHCLESGMLIKDSSVQQPDACYVLCDGHGDKIDKNRTNSIGESDDGRTTISHLAIMMLKSEPVVTEETQRITMLLVW